VARRADCAHRARGLLPALALVICGAAAAHPKALQEATVHYQAGNWGEAFHRLSLLADAGHPDAARIALFMRRYSVQMYGSYWHVDEQRVQRWERAAARPPGTAATSRTTTASP